MKNRKSVIREKQPIMKHRMFGVCAVVASVIAVSVSLGARSTLAAEAPLYRAETRLPACGTTTITRRVSSSVPTAT